MPHPHSAFLQPMALQRRHPLSIRSGAGGGVFFLPRVSGGGSDKFRVIDLAGVLRADGSLSPSPPVLGDGVKANRSVLELLLLLVERSRLVEHWYYWH